MQEAPPNRKMTSKDKIPRKTKGQGSRKFAEKDRKSPPENVARKRNMDSPLSSEYEDEDDQYGDKDLEEAQNRTFGKKRPDFKSLKSDEGNLKPLEKGKEDGEIQTAHDEDAGKYSPKEYADWVDANKEKFLEVKSHLHYRAYTKESERKPILRDPNGKAIGTGSFWLRQPFDYSDRERDLPQKEFDRVRTQDLTFTDRQRRCAADDVSVDSDRPEHEKPSDWQIRTGVQMTTRDSTFDTIDHNKKLDMANSSQEQTWRNYTPWQRQNLQILLTGQKKRAAKVLQQKKDILADTKKRVRSKSRSQSNDPPVRSRKGKTKKSQT
jgi:hypothetical protein